MDMLKKICYLVFYFVVFLFLFIVFCGNVYAKDNSVELKWIQKDISNDPNYRGNIIIAEMNDGYFTINNLGDIVKYDFNGKKDQQSFSAFGHFQSCAGNRLRFGRFWPLYLRSALPRGWSVAVGGWFHVVRGGTLGTERLVCIR